MRRGGGGREMFLCAGDGMETAPPYDSRFSEAGVFVREKPDFFRGVLAAVFAAGFVLGVCAAALFFAAGYGRERDRFGERLEQVNGDLERARVSQREAAERARRLHEELEGIAGYARSVEEGTRRYADRAGGFAERLDSVIEHSGEIGDGIERAQASIESSGVLIGELGTILRGLQGGGGNADTEP